MLPLIPIASCPNLAVPAAVMQHVVDVESGNNPFAIGVVGARLARQPQNLDEAVVTARMLESRGYNFSLGVAQVNRSNLTRYGLDSYDKAFDLCRNLAAGTQILAQCYAQAGGDWGKSFSCYYSGNFVTGYEDGYVQKVYDSFDRSPLPRSIHTRALPIQVVQTAHSRPVAASDDLVQMRSSAIDHAAAAAVTQIAGTLTSSVSSPATITSPDPNAMQAPPVTSAIPLNGSAATAIARSNDIFVPQVRGPNDPVGAEQASAPTPTSAPTPSIDHADLRQGGHDDAFVF